MNVMLLGYLGLILTTTEQQSILVFCGYKLYDVDAPFSSGLTAIINVTREEVECKNSEYNIINAKRVPVNNSNQPCFIQKDFEWNKANLPWYSIASADSNQALPASTTVTLTTMYKGAVTALDPNAGVAILNGQKAVSLVTDFHTTISNFAIYDGKPRVGVVYTKNSLGEPINKNMQHYALIRCVEQFKLLTYFKNRAEQMEQNTAVLMSEELRSSVLQRMVEAANIGKALQKNEVVDPNRLRVFTAITNNYIAVFNKNLGDLNSRLQGSQVSATNTAEKPLNSAVSQQPSESAKTVATVPAVKPVESKPVASAITPAQPPKSEAQPVQINSEKQASQETVNAPAPTSVVTTESVSKPETAPVVEQKSSETPVVEPTAKYLLNKAVTFTDIDEDDDTEPVADLNGTEYDSQAALSYSYTAGGAKASGVIERDIEREKMSIAAPIMGKRFNDYMIVTIYESRSALFDFLLKLSEKYIPGSEGFWDRSPSEQFIGNKLEDLTTAMTLAKLIETESVRDIRGNSYELLREFLPNMVCVGGIYKPDKRPFSIVTSELRSPAGHSLGYYTMDFQKDGVSIQPRSVQQVNALIDNKTIINAKMENGAVKYITHFIGEDIEGGKDDYPVYRLGVMRDGTNNTPIAVYKQSNNPLYTTYGRRDQFGNIKILRDDEIDEGYINSLTTLDLEYIYNWLNINVFATAAGGCAPNLRVFGIDEDNAGVSNYSECMYVFYKESESQTKSVFEMSSTNTGEISKRLGGYSYVIRPVAVGVNLDRLSYAHEHSVVRGGSAFTSFYSAFILMMLFASGYNIPTWLKDFNASTRVIDKEFPDINKSRKGDMVSLYVNCMQRLRDTLGTVVPSTSLDFATATLTLGHKSAGYIYGNYNTGDLDSFSISNLSSKSACFYSPRRPEDAVDKRLKMPADLFRISDLSLTSVENVMKVFYMLPAGGGKPCTLKSNERCLGEWFKDHSIFNTREFGVESIAPAVILQQRAVYVAKKEKQAYEVMWKTFSDNAYQLTGADIADFADSISTTKNLDSYQSLSSIPSDMTQNLCYDSAAAGATIASSVYVHDIVTEKQAGYALWAGLLRGGGGFIETLIRFCHKYRTYNVINGIVPLVLDSCNVLEEFGAKGDNDVSDLDITAFAFAFVRRWLASFVLTRAIYTSNISTIPSDLLKLYDSIHIPFNASPDELLNIPEIQEALREDSKFNIDFLIRSDTVDYSKLYKMLLGVAILRYFPMQAKNTYERYNGYGAGLAAFFLKYKYKYSANSYKYDIEHFSTYHMFENMQRLWVILDLQFGDFAGVWASDIVKGYNSQSLNLMVSLCDLFERIRVMPTDMSMLSKNDFFLSFFGRIGYLTFVLLAFSECNINKFPQEYWSLLSRPSLQGLSSLESKYHDLFVTIGKSGISL